ncbi:MAG TPA: YMGG-like glycine zipper-containing protein [Candidatus Sulfomarinibacteraceae bacterium]|nr:YMGG-like glycine zipper-containing protein [Candidatus Sulfomarinibacteraceae bacterium]
MEQEDTPTRQYQYAGIGLIFGAAIGFILGGPVGAAMGCGVGLIVGAIIDGQRQKSTS